MASKSIKSIARSGPEVSFQCFTRRRPTNRSSPIFPRSGGVVSGTGPVEIECSRISLGGMLLAVLSPTRTKTTKVEEGLSVRFGVRTNIGLTVRGSLRTLLATSLPSSVRRTNCTLSAVVLTPPEPRLTSCAWKMKRICVLVGSFDCAWSVRMRGEGQAPASAFFGAAWDATKNTIPPARARIFISHVYRISLWAQLSAVEGSR